MPVQKGVRGIDIGQCALKALRLEMIDGKPTALTYTGAGHIMGTCRMGDDARTSVVDANQCSHDHRNLFLVGSSTFPTGATANPTLTLAALSMKTADEIIKRFG